jgi:hypothetical protein
MQTIPFRLQLDGVPILACDARLAVLPGEDEGPPSLIGFRARYRGMRISERSPAGLLFGLATRLNLLRGKREREFTVLFGHGETWSLFARKEPDGRLGLFARPPADTATALDLDETPLWRLISHSQRECIEEIYGLSERRIDLATE